MAPAEEDAGARPLARWSRATLSLYSDTGSAARVSVELGLAPTSVHEKGDARRSGDGREYAPFATSVWNYEPDTSTIDANDDSGIAALRALINDIGGRAEALSRLRPEYRTAIRWSGEVGAQGNFTIDADLIVELGRLGCEFYGTAIAQEFNEDEA